MSTILDEPRGTTVYSTTRLMEHIVRQESALTDRILSDRAELKRLTAENERLRRQNVRYLAVVEAARMKRDIYKSRMGNARTQLAEERYRRKRLQEELQRARPALAKNGSV
jgi:hypothetical protein